MVFIRGRPSPSHLHIMSPHVTLGESYRMDPRTGIVCAGDSYRVRAAVMRIIKEARDSAELEQRRSIRVPFFRPVLVGMNDGEPPHFSAFCRDLSIYGIGLLHIM